MGAAKSFEFNTKALAGDLGLSCFHSIGVMEVHLRGVGECGNERQRMQAEGVCITFEKSDPEKLRDCS